MPARRSLALVAFVSLASMGAAYPTTNFMVEAPTPEIAQQVGQAAEYYRKQKALEWLGQEMAPWPERCPLKVHVTMNGPGGATSFAFDRGRVLGQHMHIEGPLDRLLASVLPHEVTHTVFAYYFRRPLPRWADEGGAVLSEDDIERDRHDRLVRHILNTPGRRIPLRRLFSLQDYPSDVMVLYAEGFSVASYLVNNSNKQTFLAFIGQGMSGNNWDYAVRACYHMNSVEELEEAWLTHLRNTKRQPMQLAQNTTTSPSVSPMHRVILRQTVPPGLSGAAPVYRGQSEDNDRDASGQRGGARPGYLPDYDRTGRGAATIPGAVLVPASSSQWQPPGVSPYPPPTVQLGTPQPTSPYANPPLPTGSMPAGYPR
jgi:hypothetical protein